MWRRLAVLLVFLIGATCAHSDVPPNWTIRDELCCMEPDKSTAAVDCAKREGCSYGPRLLHCGGARPSREDEARDRERSQRCEVPCACTCPADIDDCIRRP